MLQSTVRTPRASEINNESPSVVSAGTAEEKLVPSSESAAVAFDTTLGHIITYAAGGPVSGCQRLAQNLTLRCPTSATGLGFDIRFPGNLSFIAQRECARR